MKKIYFSILKNPFSHLSSSPGTIGTILFLLFFVGLNPLALKAQYAVPTTGGDHSGINGKMSLTIGQPVYSSYTDVGGSESQGVQQSYCNNPISGGTIGNSQDICSGDTPALLQNLTAPEGYVMPLEYKWVVSTTSELAGFTDIAASNTEDYQPSSLTQTTWFKRLSRVSCKADWSDAVASNVVKVTVESTPVAGNLSKTPDVIAVCENENVSAALIPGTGGNGVDETEYRTNNGSWSGWTSYTSGQEIATTGLTTIEIRTRAMGSSCPASAYNTVSWDVDPVSVPGSIAGTTSIVYGSSTDILILSGYVGVIEKWQKKHEAGSWMDIANTSALYSETPSSTGVWYYRAFVKSGNCSEVYTNAHQITVAKKQLTISDPILTLSKVYDATTNAFVTSGILSGVESGDNVVPTAQADYDDEVVGTNKQITVVYTLDGTEASNYIEPVNFVVNTGEITNAKAFNVRTDVGYATAQQAIDAASPGDEIEVYYNPTEPLIINKVLQIHYVFNRP